MISAAGSDRAGRALAAIGAALLISSASAAAIADSTAADKAAAEVLFNDAQRLVKEGKYAEACPKYAESLRLDTGIGTMLYLADCYEKNGQTASAWGQFREAASAAKNAGQSDREKKAIDRAAALEPKLLKVTVSVAPDADVPGLEVKRDGQIINKALLNTPMPLDPGDHVIEASAPGKKTWSTTVKLAEGATAPAAVQIPVLEVDPEANKPKVDPNAGKGDGRPIIINRTEPVNVGAVFGYTAAGLGIVGIGAGSVLGVLAINKNSAANSPGSKRDLSDAKCTPNNVCNQEGEKLRQSALSFATGSTVAMIAGGALLVGGVITVVLTRKSSTPAKQAGFSVSPVVGPGAGGVFLRGGF